MTEIELRTAVCTQARSWLGRKEADGSHREIIDLYNKYRKPGDYCMTYADPWCAAFSSAVGMAVSVAKGLSCKPNELIPSSAACDPKIAEYKRLGRWIEDDAYLPTPGDEIFYDWQDSGAGDNTGSSDHVGIVVDVSGSSITVIEGNKSDMVAYRTIQRNGRYIRGYGIPNYTGAATGAAATGGQSAAAEPSAGSTEAATPTVSFTLSLPQLKIGDKGNAVKAMQGELIAMGYGCGPDGADGDFGNNTRNAVLRFQSAHGLEVDGVCGKNTRTALLGIKS